VLAELNVKESFKVATKVFPFTPGSHRPENLRAQFLESLSALQMDSVEIFYLHAPDHATPFEDTLQEVHQLHQEGKFKEFGLSNFASWNVMEIWQICKSKGFILPTVYQGRYHALSRDVERELLPCLRKLNIRFYAYNPLCGGLFAGKLSFENIPIEGRFRINSIQGERYRERYWKKAYFEVLETLKIVCSNHKISMIEAALRWIMNHSALNGAAGDGI
jgi:aflatoxin B1 aldehyde reductase